ncbi:hypothetical protein IMSAGC011_03305 [Lachnospiraceae bacterium]|nr:hypothetical protein IMSAGC011_03305 [Lachnospiraceae bacterium]
MTNIINEKEMKPDCGILKYDEGIDLLSGNIELAGYSTSECIYHLWWYICVHPVNRVNMLPRHSVPLSLSFSALGRMDCGGVLSLLSALILDIIC